MLITSGSLSSAIEAHRLQEGNLAIWNDMSHHATCSLPDGSCPEPHRIVSVSIAPFYNKPTLGVLASCFDLITIGLIAASDEASCWGLFSKL